ncbi:GmrSD restriction endonuclease domain-containing protein [Vibrio parahaemolyticus]|uniref:GmrSD restriction endonuclease domain-containing protein n=3 Tax=Vibrionaceae TaxID=641 RepID=UPI003AB04CE8
MYNLVKEIRNKDYSELVEIFDKKLSEMDEQWSGFEWFRLHGQNGRFVKYLLSRLSGYIDGLAGENTDFATYYHATNGKPYEIEHLWANNFDNHRDEFEQLNDFNDARNSIGALVLLPRGTNQSYSDKPYTEKVEHYIKENLLVKSLHPLAYENNPNFNKLISNNGLAFQAHAEMKMADVQTRRDLYRQIAEQIWCLEEVN